MALSRYTCDPAKARANITIEIEKVVTAAVDATAMEIPYVWLIAARLVAQHMRAHSSLPDGWEVFSSADDLKSFIGLRHKYMVVVLQDVCGVPIADGIFDSEKVETCITEAAKALREIDTVADYKEMHALWSQLFGQLYSGKKATPELAQSIVDSVPGLQGRQATLNAKTEGLKLEATADAA
eukprot:2250238-Pyramimonas_sp.AAC.1